MSDTRNFQLTRWLPDPTLFSFPSRHHPLPDSSESVYRAGFVYPTGLHPTLRLTFPTSSMPAPSENCALHTYLILPSILFPDKYQLSAPLFLASKNLQSIRSIAGETDLEAPDWAITKWGSAMLIELAPPSQHQGPWRAEIPLHLRYLDGAKSGKTQAEIPWPVVFWACTAEEGSKMSNNPFDRVNLGYDGLFGPKTMFYHLRPQRNLSDSSEILLERLQVPVFDMSKSHWVETGTVTVIGLALVWILGKLAQTAMNNSISFNGRPADENKKQ